MQTRKCRRRKSSDDTQGCRACFGPLVGTIPLLRVAALLRVSALLRIGARHTRLSIAARHHSGLTIASLHGHASRWLTVSSSSTKAPGYTTNHCIGCRQSGKVVIHGPGFTRSKFHITPNHAVPNADETAVVRLKHVLAGELRGQLKFELAVEMIVGMVSVELPQLVRSQVMPYVISENVMIAVLVEVELAVLVVEERLQHDLTVMRRQKPIRRNCGLQGVVSHS